LKEFTVIEMVFIEPVICNFHGELHVDFEFLRLVFFNTPVEIAFSDSEGRGRGGLL
jgi:hypothetical protein